jgi:hypothetical protein
MDTLGGRSVWAFVSRHVQENFQLVFDDAEAEEERKTSVYILDGLIIIEVTLPDSSDKARWRTRVSQASADELSDAGYDPTVPWSAAVANFVNANVHAFRAMDHALSGDAALGHFADRVAADINPDVLFIAQPQRLGVIDETIVHFSGPQLLADGALDNEWVIGLWKRGAGWSSVEMQVVLDTSVAICTGYLDDEPRVVLRGGPIFEAANRLCHVLKDAPALPQEAKHPDAEWTGAQPYQFYYGAANMGGDNRRLPDAAVPLLESLRQRIWIPVCDLDDEETSVVPIPDVAFEYFDGHVEFVRAADLVVAPTAAAGDTNATATAKMLGLEHVGDGDVSAFYALDENGENDSDRPLRTIGDLVTALAERGPDPTSFLVTFIPPPPSPPPPAADLAAGFFDRA